MIYPGTTYKTTEELLVNATIHYGTSHSKGFEFTLPQATEFIISIWTEPVNEYIQIWLLKPELFELQVVAQERIDSAKYDSFSLKLKRVEIEQKATLTYNFSDAIYFYSPIDNYGEFSNFSEHGIEHEGAYYPTVEHFFQSQKFLDAGYSERIRKSQTPKEASILGRSRDFEIKKDWDQIKDDIMLLAVRKKFESNENLKKLLLSTEDKILIENSPYDNYWGIGRTGEGFNKLGVILMRIRELIKTSA